MVDSRLEVAGVILLGCFILTGAFWSIGYIASLQEREIVRETYGDPYEVSTSSLPDFDNLSIDNSEGGADWEKVTLPYPCVDGENTETYVMVSKGSSENLLFYFEGGGGGTDYLSSKFMTVTLDPRFEYTKKKNGGVFNRGREQNPFQDWTYVFVPYGTGDFQSGNRVMRYSRFPGMEMTVHHVGYFNGVVIQRWVENQRSFDKVVLAGSSAGGYGTIMHFNSTREIFDQPVTVIDDAGPGLLSKRTPDFTHSTTAKSWGYENNLPKGALEYLEDNEPIYYVGYTLDKYENSFFGLYEDKWDVVIGSSLLRYTPHEFARVLIGTTNDLRESYPDRFVRFIPEGFDHVSLWRKRFYDLEIENVRMYEWVDNLIHQKPDDLVEE